MAEKQVVDGSRVKVEYIARLADGTIVDKSEKNEPLEFTVGSGDMIEGFDEAVRGMKLNEEKIVRVPPEKAYGTTGNHPLAGKTMVFWIKLVYLK